MHMVRRVEAADEARVEQLLPMVVSLEPLQSQMKDYPEFAGGLVSALIADPTKCLTPRIARAAISKCLLPLAQQLPGALTSDAFWRGAAATQQLAAQLMQTARDGAAAPLEAVAAAVAAGAEAGGPGGDGAGAGGAGAVGSDPGHGRGMRTSSRVRRGRREFASIK